jgi:hypothetical protein
MRVFQRTDLEQINTWLKSRGVSELCDCDIPTIGLIEDDVACGFLVQCDCSVAFLEAFITNPKAGLKARSKSVWSIAKKLLCTASATGYKRCIILSKSKSLQKIGTELGFSFSNSKVLAKNF